MHRLKSNPHECLHGLPWPPDIMTDKWADIEALITQQSYMFGTGQKILQLLQQGWWQSMLNLDTHDLALAGNTPSLDSSLIGIVGTDDLSNPDHWLLERWLTDIAILQDNAQVSLQEWWPPLNSVISVKQIF